ncbi:TIGR00730 family Rossman fold protein [Ureibacillus aquaedulcis]|uniref:Cytokinin riboside 5'-monophosphate phosphoribohydrolase n=1 Tax=Ureibacillus aquaedulcis TaxID=3058421 RepID=A0ABT8GVL7_9BACL|nr:TIGR00730 family Rossman fold protein [Ureibacillus sp. BA0131]MDN4495427.1 TIGR00730 family Rossman fold protein [Ureibacillus sp. BA0131]
MNVAIYCGSQAGKKDIYIEKAKELGETLAKAQIGIVYGGSNVGLMGAVADASLAHSGRVIGIMPEHLQKREIAHLHLTEIHFVESMHIRKKQMVDLSDAYIALPGGCGTLDEYFEVFTWAQIGLHQNPVILYNIDGFYDALILHFEKMIEEGFIREEQRDILRVATTADEILHILGSHQEVLLKMGS